ncbi:hypothetical protein AAFF_G00344490 [Aldrovandia affinis]|uniref:Tyrosine specific protein phosphatases domain-containing protein n=1 Tax=Aldrovandia affinis TaxID=143900 RepID=A0AAD7WPZ6_9TELE|nr:hypothetical protein AAFF_G00344490 [Aldrovandia affinis]
MAAIEPENFSWVEPGFLAGMALPKEPAHLQYLVNHGIKHLVSIEPTWKMSFLKDFPQLISHPIVVVDFEAPTRAQINEFLSIVKSAKAKNEPVGVHCDAGSGRTGTFLACYLAVTRK